MKLLLACILGISGTALMTLFMYLMSYITRRPVKVVKILGTMITSQTTPEKGLSEKPYVIITGIIAHYLIGILFALVFVYIYYQKVLAPTFLDAVFFGLGTGVVGVLGWILFFTIHRNPPRIPLRPYLTDLFFAHLFFGVGIWIAYKVLVSFVVV